jgi:hypothetical protein
MITLPSVGVWRGYRLCSATCLLTCNCCVPRLATVLDQAMITESLPGPQPFGPLCIRRHALVCLLTRWHLDNSLMPTHNTTSHVCPITGNTYTTHLPTLTYGTQDTSQGPDITGQHCRGVVAWIPLVYSKDRYTITSSNCLDGEQTILQEMLHAILMPSTDRAYMHSKPCMMMLAQVMTPSSHLGATSTIQHHMCVLQLAYVVQLRASPLTYVLHVVLQGPDNTVQLTQRLNDAVQYSDVARRTCAAHVRRCISSR